MAGLVDLFETAIVGLANVGRARPFAPEARAQERPGGAFAVGAALPFGESGPAPGTRVEISADLLSKHVAIYGGSGAGKSTLMRRLRLHAYAGAFATLDLDFAGDSTDVELRQLAFLGADAPETSLIDLRQHARVAPFNLLGGPGSAHSRAAALVKALKSESEGWGVRINYHALSGGVALAELGFGIGEFRPLFSVEAGFRRHVLSGVEDELARAALREFDRLPPDTQRAHWLELANKLSNLSFDPAFRLMAGQSGFPDLSEALDSPKRATLVALGSARQVAAVVVAKALLSAVERHVMARAETGESERQPARIFVDEASRVAGFGLESLLAEGRRMKCSLTLALQHSQQVEPSLRAAMRSNCSVQVLFAAGGTEAAEFASEVVCDLPRERVRDALISLRVGQALIVRRGEPTVMVQMPDSPPADVDRSELSAFREAALARKGVPRECAEREIAARRDWIEGLNQETGGEGPKIVHGRRPRRGGGDE